MKKINLLLFGLFLAFCTISCDDDDNNKKNFTGEEEPGTEDTSKSINTVSQFAYDGMSLYYKWADEMKDKEPTSSDTDPKKYFYSLLSDSDTEHGWSWITDDVQGLLEGFSGVEEGFGYNLIFRRGGDDKIYAFVKYVFPNTPAAEAGIQRLDIIGEVNGKPITVTDKGYISKESIDALYGNTATTFSLYKLKDNKIVPNKNVTVTPKKINTNPVLLDTVYTIGSKKIGYLFYTGFIYDYNESLYKAFSKFKKEAVTDFVLDLRYNHGGAISSAVYLTSMIAPKSSVSGNEILTTLDYNKDINKLFDEKKWARSDKLGTYNSKKFSNPLNANLNLNKVYIIATNDSFSASELTTFCLRSYMDVVHIGNKTGGKYTASWTIHPYDGELGITVYDGTKLPTTAKDSLKNWAMQPIVAKYTNKEGKTFEDTDGLLPDYKLIEGNGRLSGWTALGDTKDVFLGKALYLITGDAKYNPKTEATTKGGANISIETINHKISNVDELKKKAVILDNIKLTTKQKQAIIKLRKKL